jgi:hypothetical protein
MMNIKYRIEEVRLSFPHERDSRLNSSGGKRHEEIMKELQMSPIIKQ